MIVSFEENFKKDLRREDNTIKISKCILVTKDNVNFDIEFEVLQDNKFLNLSFNLDNSENLILNGKTEDDNIEIEKIEVYYSLIEEALGFTISNEDSSIPLSQCRNLFCLELPEGSAKIKCNSKLCTELESYGLNYGQKLEENGILNPTQPVSKNSYLRYFRILLDKDTKKTSQNFLDTYGNCGIEKVKTEYSNFEIYCLNISSVINKDYYVMGLNNKGDILRIQGTVDCKKSYYICGELIKTETTTIPIEKVPALTLTLTNSANAQFSIEKGCALTISYPRYQYITDSCVVTGNIYANGEVLKSNKIFLYYLDNLVEDDIANNYYWEKNQKVVCLDGNKGATREITLKCFDYEHIAGSCNIEASPEIYKFFDLYVTIEPKKENEDWATCKIKITTKQDNTEGRWIPRIDDIDPYKISLNFALSTEEGGVGFKNTYDFYLIQLPLTTFDIVGVTDGSDKYIKIKGNDIEILADEQNGFNVYDEKMDSGENHRYYLIQRNNGSLVNCKLNHKNDIINSKKTSSDSYSAVIEGYKINDFSIVRDLSGIVIYQVKKDTKIEDLTVMSWRELADIRQKNYTFTVKPNYKDFKVLLVCPNWQSYPEDGQYKEGTMLFNMVTSYHWKVNSNFPAILKIQGKGKKGEVVEIGKNGGDTGLIYSKPSEIPNILATDWGWGPSYDNWQRENLFFDLHIFAKNIFSDSDTTFSLIAIYQEEDGTEQQIPITINDKSYEKIGIQIRKDSNLHGINDLISFSPYNSKFKNYFYYKNNKGDDTSFLIESNPDGWERTNQIPSILVLRDKDNPITIKSAFIPKISITTNKNNKYTYHYGKNDGIVDLVAKDELQNLAITSKTTTNNSDNTIGYSPGEHIFCTKDDKIINDSSYVSEYINGKANSPYLYEDSYKNCGYEIILRSEAKNYYPFNKAMLSVLNLSLQNAIDLSNQPLEINAQYENTQKEIFTYIEYRKAPDVRQIFLLPAGITPTAQIKGDSSSKSKDEWIILTENNKYSFQIQTNYPLFSEGNGVYDYFQDNKDYWWYSVNEGDKKQFDNRNDDRSNIFDDGTNFSVKFFNKSAIADATVIVEIKGSNKENTMHNYIYDVNITSTEEKDFYITFPVPSLFEKEFFTQKYTDVNKGKGLNDLWRFNKDIKDRNNYPLVKKTLKIRPRIESQVSLNTTTVGIKESFVQAKVENAVFNQSKINLGDDYMTEFSEDSKTLFIKFSPRLPESAAIQYNPKTWSDVIDRYSSLNVITHDITITNEVSGIDENETISYYREGLIGALVINDYVYIGEKNTHKIYLTKKSRNSQEYSAGIKLGGVLFNSQEKKILQKDYEGGIIEVINNNSNVKTEWKGISLTLDSGIEDANFQVTTTENSKIEVVFESGEEKHKVVLELIIVPYINLSSSYYFQTIQTGIYNFIYEGNIDNLIAKVVSNGEEKICSFNSTEDPNTYGITGFFSPETLEISSAVVNGQDSYNYNKEKFQQMLYICNKDGVEISNSKITIAGIRIKVQGKNKDGELRLKNESFTNNKWSSTFTVEYDTEEGDTKNLVCIDSTYTSIPGLEISITESGDIIITKNQNVTLNAGTYPITIKIKDTGVDFKNVKLNIIIE